MFRNRIASIILRQLTRPAVLLSAAVLLTTLAHTARADDIINDQPRPTLDIPHTLAAMTPKMTADTADPAWKSAGHISGMSVALGPSEQGKVALPTTVDALWDADYLYLRFTCMDNEIYCPITGRDKDIYRNDAVEVFLDPKGDGRQ